MSDNSQVCWELYQCRDRSCPVFGDHIVGSPERMHVELTNVDAWRSGSLGPIEALGCDYFRRLRHRGRGRRSVDRNIDIFLERALRRSASFQRRLALLEQGEAPKLDELNLLGQFSQLLPTMKTVDEVCFALLTVITAGQGLGFNRAMLFWREEELNSTFGRAAIGPLDDQEAVRIWRELAEQEPWLDLKALVDSGRMQSAQNAPLTRCLRKVRLPEEPQDYTLLRSLYELQELHGSELRHSIDASVVNHLDLQHFVTLPLARAEHSLGFIAVDNRFTGVSLAPERVDILQMLVRFAASILENLLLSESLERNLSRMQATSEVLGEIRHRVARAEQLAAAGELSAAVAHEIRNPLTAIGGFSRRLLKSENLSSRDRQAAATIADESLRLEEILGRLLSRAQREDRPLRVTDLNSEIESLLNMLGDRLTESGIDLVCDLAVDLPKIPLDHQGFRQVLLNLVQNSIEAIEDQGQIRIRTMVEGNWVLVDVEDNGCGMSAEQCEKIFRAFYTTKTDGSGLGLALSQRIIRKHGGALSVSSEPERGTCFTIRMPRHLIQKLVRARISARDIAEELD
ncbi:MAG: hypothetical protein GY835_06315 [bacterium]|nr:hypothetical protein [bacterium]